MEKYTGEIVSLDGKRIIIQFEQAIPIEHPRGKVGIEILSIKYERYIHHNPDWAEEHPYNEKLLGEQISIPHSALFAAAEQYHNKKQESDDDSIDPVELERLINQTEIE